MSNIIPFDHSNSNDKHAKAPVISPQAIVEDGAEIGAGCEIGPFSVIGPKVCIAPGTRIQNNVTITGDVKIGKNNLLMPGTVIGGPPQDLTYDDTETKIIIGDNNVFRECVTVNQATTKEDRLTKIGNNCYFMGCVHVAHDCKVGNNVVIANGSMLGGHVHVHDFATISGNVGVHHFSRIGAYSFVAGLARVIQDAPPFMLHEGIPSRPRCLNIVALKRNDFDNQTIKALNEAYRLLYRSRVGLENAREIMKNKDINCDAVDHLFEYVDYQNTGRHGRGRDRRKAA